MGSRTLVPLLDFQRKRNSRQSENYLLFLSYELMGDHPPFTYDVCEKAKSSRYHSIHEYHSQTSSFAFSSGI